MTDTPRKPSTDISARWYKFASDCDDIPGYVNTDQAGHDRRILEDAWERECPGLAVPSVNWSASAGRFELSGLNIPK